ncbi:MAG: hypothetical protein JWM53_5774 [bacterium]|nr:hypothetical protein [bacterium]
MPKKKSGRRRVPDGRRWADNNKRYTALMPLDLIDEIKAEARRSGLSQSHVVREALRRGLGR